MFKSLYDSMNPDKTVTNGVNPDQTVTNSVNQNQTAPDLGPLCLLLYLNLSVMLGNYLQQTTSADIIFQMLFFGALSVKLILNWPK